MGKSQVGKKGSTVGALDNATSAQTMTAGSPTDLEFGPAFRELQLPDVGVSLLQSLAHVAGRCWQQLPGVGSGAPGTAA